MNAPGPAREVLAPMHDDPNRSIQESMEGDADTLLHEAERLEKAAAAEANPAARRILEDSVAEVRALARRMAERAAIADDPDALEAWANSLDDEHRERLEQRLKALENPEV